MPLLREASGKASPRGREGRRRFVLPQALALNTLSNGLSGVGRREEALTAIEEAVAIRRPLADARPDAFLPNLAGSLNNLSNQLSELGRQKEALAASNEAIAIQRGAGRR